MGCRNRASHAPRLDWPGGALACDLSVAQFGAGAALPSRFLSLQPLSSRRHHQIAVSCASEVPGPIWFQWATPYLIPRCETCEGIRQSRARLAAGFGSFAAGSPAPPCHPDRAGSNQSQSAEPPTASSEGSAWAGRASCKLFMIYDI
jgi:hypothetical protein